LGFSCMMTTSKSMIRIAKYIKKTNRNIINVFGGPDTYQNIFFDTKRLMKKEKSIDIVVKYEGEGVFWEIIESTIFSRYPLNKIKGIWYRDKNNVLSTGEREPMDLSTIPSPYLNNLIKLDKKTKDLVVENARGCPYRCYYCSFPLGNYGRLQYFPSNRVIKELKFLLLKKPRSINIVDNNININLERLKKILKTIIRYNHHETKIFIYFNLSRSSIPSELTDLAAQSNVIVSVGVQSVNPKALKIANRQTDLTILKNNLKLFDRKEVSYYLEFIFGLPGDNKNSIEKIIDWIFHFKAVKVLFYGLAILKGTYFSEHASELGIIHSKNPPYKFTKTKTLYGFDLVYTKKILPLVSIYYNNLLLRRTILQIHEISKRSYSRIFKDLLALSEQKKSNFLPKTQIKIANKYLNKVISLISN